MRDRSRTAIVEQLTRAPALLDPERLASGAGSLLRHGVHYALKRAFERGGASWSCAIICIDARFNGRMPAQVKQGALLAGEDLAVTSPAVV